MASKKIELNRREVFQTTGALARRPSLQGYSDYLIFAVCAGCYLLPFMRYVISGSNEGTLVEGAARIVQGQVFARDFFEVMGPGTFYWLAAFFRLFGVTFAAERICVFLTSLGTGLLIYFLSRRICSAYRTLPCFVLAGTYFGMQWPGASHHLDSNFFALLSVACIVKWHDCGRRSLLFAAGALAGFTTCILQPKGMLLLFSLLLWLCMRRGGRTARISSMGLTAFGFFVVAGFALLYFWSQAALGSLYYANIVWPSRNYSAANSVPYALGLFDQYWKHWIVAKIGFEWTVGMASILIAPFLFIALLPALLPVLAVRYRWKEATPDAVLYLLCGIALWLSELHRKDIYHLVFGSPLLVVLCVHLMAESRRKAADFALQILSIVAFSLATFNLFQVVVTAHSIATRVGPVAMYKDDPVLSFLDSRTVPGEEIFVYPFAPMYYFLSATANPTRFSILEYTYNTTSEFQEVIQVLDRRKVRYVLWDTNFEAKTAPIVFPECPRMSPSRYLIEPYLESHYDLVKDVNGLRIMERKGGESAN